MSNRKRIESAVTVQDLIRLLHPDMQAKAIKKINDEVDERSNNQIATMMIMAISNKVVDVINARNNAAEGLLMFMAQNSRFVMEPMDERNLNSLLDASRTVSSTS
jgi:hypothetical protein